MTCKTLLAAAALALAAALPAVASPVAAPSLVLDDIALAYSEFEGAGDLSGFGITATLSGAAASADLILTFDAGNPYGPATTGALDVRDATGLLLGSILDSLTFGSGVLTAVFAVVDGSRAAEFGGHVTFAIPIATDPFAGLSDGDSLTGGPVTGAADLAPVPLPGGLALLAAGIAALGLGARRRRLAA